MKLLNMFALILCIALVAIVSTNGRGFTSVGTHIRAAKEADGSTNRATDKSGKAGPVLSYRLDASQSRFMVRTFSGGLLWFKGHDHFIAIPDFTGEIQLTPGAVAPASLELRVRADSLKETREVFTEQQKQIINREIRELVLETAKYPEIIFKSTDVTGKLTGGQYEAKIGGDLTLHGVTRHIVIPAQVTLDGNGLRAHGEFTINRGDYKVKATSALNGTIRVRDKLKFTFDIVARQS